MSDPWPLRLLPEKPDQLPAHLQGFDCGKEPLNDFLRRSALFNQQAGVSRTTYVHPPGDPNTVAGYYSVALGVVLHEEVPLPVRRRLIERAVQPVALLARLAVDRRFTRRGLGSRLLIAAIADLLAVCDRVGAPLIAVEAIDDAAVTFYKRYGFLQPEGSQHMFLRASTARRLFSE